MKFTMFPSRKKAVDDIMNKVDNVSPDLLFVVKGPQFRNGGYSYDQFVTATWDEAIEMMMTNGGPQVHAYNLQKTKAALLEKAQTK